jgi:hypothetical protein
VSFCGSGCAAAVADGISLAVEEDSTWLWSDALHAGVHAAAVSVSASIKNNDFFIVIIFLLVFVKLGK